jgi:hypothetical protein
MPRFLDFQESTDAVIEEPGSTGRRVPRTGSAGTRSSAPARNLLEQETVLMTVFAQDPSVVDLRGPVLARIPVPADRFQRGPRSHRLHVVDVAIGTNKAAPPTQLDDEAGVWSYTDRFAGTTKADRLALIGDRDFRAQNVFAIAAHTLALFERHLGRPIPWNRGFPHLFLVPQARIEGNAFYSREHNAVLFGWLPSIGDQPPLYTALSYDIVAHEVTHAILDGLRPRYTEPGPPDQLAFHEALADLVALFSVFGLPGVAQHLLDPRGTGRYRFPANAAGATDDEIAVARADHLKDSPLAGLAEQLGSRQAQATAHRHHPGLPVDGPYPALRASVRLPATAAWKRDRAYDQPHRRAEVLVAAFMQTFVAMWADRLRPLAVVRGGMDVSRVAEEGVKSAAHLLGMLLRALDYLPPVDLEFADVIDSVITADKRLAPEDEHDYRGTLERSFKKFGIVAPEHYFIVDTDGTAAPKDPAPTVDDPFLADPDASVGAFRYEHLNFVSLRTSPEEIYQFIWNNSATLRVDVRFSTRIERVLANTRVGPDGLILNEIIADYTQILRTTAGQLPTGMKKPARMADDTTVELWGGGVLVFDQFGRFRLHQRQPMLDTRRQNLRLAYLFRNGLQDRHGGVGASDGVGERFLVLHGDGVTVAPTSSTPDAGAERQALELLAQPAGTGAAAWLIRSLNRRPPTA